MTSPFRVGSIFTYRDKTYCVLSFRQLGRGVVVTAVEVRNTQDNDWWYSFYFTPALLAEVNTRATLDEGRQGEGEHRHG